MPSSQEPCSNNAKDKNLFLLVYLCFVPAVESMLSLGAPDEAVGFIGINRVTCATGHPYFFTNTFYSITCAIFSET